MGVKDRIIVPNRMFLEGVFSTLAVTGFDEMPESVVVLVEGTLIDVYSEGWVRGREARESCQTQKKD